MRDARFQGDGGLAFSKRHRCSVSNFKSTNLALFAALKLKGTSFL